MNPGSPKYAPPAHAKSAAETVTNPGTGSGTEASVSPESALEVLPSLSGYNVIRKIGEGGMGAVYLAEDINLRRRVAIKTMKPELAADRANRERFEREARAAAAVEDDNIVPIFHIGETTDRTPFIVMPFLQGEMLDARLKREPVPPLALLLKVAREVAAGLAAAHERGLIHRDIKPGNIWLEGDLTAQEPSRQVRRCKILDFGLARSVDGGDAQLTASGAILGTPAFMAPEQARGERVDARSDLFSLGVTLYRMATGHPPFQGTSAIAVLISLTTETPQPVRALRPNVPPELAKLIERLIAKDPAGRPRSATEVVEAVDRIGTDGTIPDTPSVPSSVGLPAGLESTAAIPQTPAVVPTPSTADTISASADTTSVPAPRISPPSAARVLLTELVTGFVLVALVAAACAAPWAAYPSPVRWMIAARAFVLTATLAWALVLAGRLPTPTGRYPWLPRTVQLAIGLGIGALAFWCDGWAFNALGDAPASETMTLNGYRISRDSFWTCLQYMLYFGVPVALSRWWITTDRERKWMVRFGPFLLAVGSSVVFLPLWPRHSPPLAIGVAVIVGATLAVQIASPRTRLPGGTRLDRNPDTRDHELLKA